MRPELRNSSDRLARPRTALLPLRAAAGVSLVELLLVIVCVSILVAVAVPGYRYVTNNNRIAAEVNGLLGDMQYARAEAVREGQPVTVCSSSNGTQCSNSTSWQNGWIVFSDLNNDQTVDGPDVVLRKQASFAANGDTFAAGNGVSAVTFNREGFANFPLAVTTTTNFTLHDQTSTSTWTRCLAVSVVGQLTTETSGVGGCL